MANYLSQPTQYAPAQSQFNEELALKVLEAKQGRYDLNEAKIDATIAQYNKMEFINKEAKEEFYNNITKVIDAVNETKIKDLSDSSVSRKILGAISSALTPETLRHNRIALEYKAANEKWDKLYEKNPDKYSDGNRKYAERISGIQDYIRDGDYTIVNMSRMNPIDYSDYNANAIKALKDLQTIRGKEEHKWTDPQTGVTYTTTDHVLSKSDILMLGDQLFNEKDRMQMRIDASNSINISGAGGRELIVDNLKKLNDNSIDSISNDIANLKVAQNLPGTTTDMVNKYSERINELERFKKTLQSRNFQNLSDVDLEQLQERVIYSQTLYNLAFTEGKNVSTGRTIPDSVLKRMHEAQKKPPISPVIVTYFDVPIDTTGKPTDAIKYHEDQMTTTMDMYHSQNDELYSMIVSDPEVRATLADAEQRIASQYFDEYGVVLDPSSEEDRRILREAIVEEYMDQPYVVMNPRFLEVKNERFRLQDSMAQSNAAKSEADKQVNAQMAPLLAIDIWEESQKTVLPAIMPDPASGGTKRIRDYLRENGVNSAEELQQRLGSGELPELQIAIDASKVLSPGSFNRHGEIVATLSEIGDIVNRVSQLGDKIDSGYDIEAEYSFRVTPKIITGGVIVDYAVGLDDIRELIKGNTISIQVPSIVGGAPTTVDIRPEDVDSTSLVKAQGGADITHSLLQNTIGSTALGRVISRTRVGDITNKLRDRETDIVAQTYNTYGVGSTPRGVTITAIEPNKGGKEIALLSNLTSSKFSLDDLRQEYRTEVSGKDVIVEAFQYNPKEPIRIYKEPRAGEDIYAVSQLNSDGETLITYVTRKALFDEFGHGTDEVSESITQGVLGVSQEASIRYIVPYEVESRQFKGNREEVERLSIANHLLEQGIAPEAVNAMVSSTSKSALRGIYSTTGTLDSEVKVILDSTVENLENFRVKKRVEIISNRPYTYLDLIYNDDGIDTIVGSRDLQVGASVDENTLNIAMATVPEFFIRSFLLSARAYGTSISLNTPLTTSGRSGEEFIQNMRRIFGTQSQQQ